jgi:hypothetical protein
VPYFFHSDGDREELDHQGTELTDLAEARDQAVSLIASILNDGDGVSIWRGMPLKLSVTDGPPATGKTLFTLTLSVLPGIA